MLVVYLASLIRSVVALHNLINNKISNRDAERKEGQEKEEGKKEKKDDKEKKEEKEKEKGDGKKDKEKKKWVRLPSGFLSSHTLFDRMVSYFLSRATTVCVCGAPAKSRPLYEERCHLRVGLAVTTGTHKTVNITRGGWDDACVFHVL